MADLFTQGLCTRRALDAIYGQAVPPALVESVDMETIERDLDLLGRAQMNQSGTSGATNPGIGQRSLGRVFPVVSTGLCAPRASRRLVRLLTEPPGSLPGSSEGWLTDCVAA